MVDTKTKKKRKAGRPPLPMPDPIPDTAENVAAAMFKVPAKKRDEWRYLKERRKETSSSD